MLAPEIYADDDDDEPPPSPRQRRYLKLNEVHQPELGFRHNLWEFKMGVKKDLVEWMKAPLMTLSAKSLQELLSSPPQMDNPGLDLDEEKITKSDAARPDGEPDDSESVSGTPRYRSRVPSIVVVNRPVYSQQYFDEGFQPAKLRGKTIKDRFRARKDKCACSLQCFKALLFRFLPFLDIMRHYDVRENLMSDIISGITVGIMHIPQGMAYAMLASLSPVYGIYTSFFPVILYFFLGTSRHISVGTFAVVSLMIGSCLDRETANFQPLNVTNATGAALNDLVDGALMNEKIKIAVQVTVLAGVIQAVMGICQLGFFTIYLSQPLVSGFTTGAAFHVFTSQVVHIFGLSITKYNGPWKLIYIYRDFFVNIEHTNIAVLITSLICIAVLISVKEGINNRFKDKMKMPVPIELLVVVAATVISHFCFLHETYDVKIVGHIPTGIPAPQPPQVNYMGNVFLDAIIIAIVGYAISVSLAKIFANRHNYEIDSNQELLAHGGTNIVCSFFMCYVSSASLSRSLIQEGMGGKTQIAGLLSSTLVLVVLLAVGPLFRALPNCVLASIIIVALKGMFLQFKQLKDLWKISKYDFFIWIVSCLATTLLDVDLGLGVSLAFTLFTVVWRTQGPYTCVMGRMPHTDIYRDINVYNSAEEVTGIKIFRFGGSLYYASSEHFRDKLYKKTGMNPTKLLAVREKIQTKRKRAEEKKAKEQKKIDKKIRNKSNHSVKISEQDNISSIQLEMTPDDRHLDNIAVDVQTNGHVPADIQNTTHPDNWPMFDCHHLILDCSVMGYMDCVGVNTLSTIIQEYKKADVTVFLTSCNYRIRDILRKMNFFDKNPKDCLFVSLHDAVLAACEENDQNFLQSLLIDTPMFPTFPYMDARGQSAGGSPCSFKRFPTPKHGSPKSPGRHSSNTSPKAFRRHVGGTGSHCNSPSLGKDRLEVPRSCQESPETVEPEVLIEESEEVVLQPDQVVNEEEEVTGF